MIPEKKEIFSQKEAERQKNLVIEKIMIKFKGRKIEKDGSIIYRRNRKLGRRLLNRQI
ncbi:MAG: hypothetical protein Q4C61_03155 [Lachnospiraceae bacterium]|nr:hypothetical protein [Lachnospiraceae bacterium]